MLTRDDGRYFLYEKVGEFFHDDRWIHPRRRMESYVLILVLEGVVWIEEEGVEYELSQNDIILLEPGKEHGGTRESITRTDFYWLVFKTDMALPFKVLKDADTFDVKYLLKHLMHIANSSAGFGSMAEAAGLLVFEELNRCCAESVKGGTFAHRIAEYVRINAGKNLSVNKIAKDFGYSADHIGRLFRKYFNMSLNEYITASKLKKAQDLLLFTDLSVKQIAFELGYDDMNAFIKYFTYHEGISPRLYRNRNYNIEMNNK